MLSLENMHVSDDTFFFVVLPLVIFSGIFAKIESYKMILIKILPFLLTLLFLIYATVNCQGEACGWIDVGAIAVSFLMVVFTAICVLATFLYRLVSSSVPKP